MKELIDPLYIPFHLLNLVAMFLILRFLIYKPVKRFLDARNVMYASAKETAEKRMAEAIAKSDEAERMLTDARTQSAVMIKEAGDLALGQQKAVLQTARRESEVYMQNARANLELEKTVVKERIKKNAVQMAIDLSQMILKREINAQEHEDIINDYMDKLG